MAYDPYIICKKAGCCSHDVELHHIIPKSIGGNDGDGRIYLCEKHHKILGLSLLKIVMGGMTLNDKEIAKQKIKAYTIE